MALRFGLEMEMHRIQLTFRRRAEFHFWDPTPSAAHGEHKAEDTMINQEAILVPLQPPPPPALPYLNGAGQVNWESTWGFRAVADKIASSLVIKPSGGIPSNNVGNCILELATAAAPANDYNYWIMSRRCAKAFAQLLEEYVTTNPADPECFTDENIPFSGNVCMRWNTLQSFIDKYNAKVAFAPDHFKFTKSASILQFENGTHVKAGGSRWDAYMVCSPLNPKFCDVQVNYQFPLRRLYSDTDAWISAWNSIWMTSFALKTIDPQVGDTGNTPLGEPYHVQTFAAMWRMAKSMVDTHFQTNLIPANDALVKALLMYILVGVSVTPLPATSASVKNSYPQLPKTSPASVARMITAIDNNVTAFFQAMINTATPAPQDEFVAITARLRNPEELIRQPGNLPTTRPSTTEPRYCDYEGGILRAFPAPAPDFTQTWRGALTLDNAHLPTPANQTGFTHLAPFYVRWAEDVNSSYPAVRYAVNNAAPQNEIRMLFESRYGRCVLNLGFNPYIDDFMFNRSYRRVLRMVMGPPALSGVPVPAGQAVWRLSELAATIDAQFPDDGRTKQLFDPAHH